MVFNKKRILMFLQIVENILEFGMRSFVQALRNKKSQLMRILAWGRNTYGTRPVVVLVCQAVCQTMDVVRRNACIVKQHVVRSRSHGSLTNALAHNIEIITIRHCHHIVNDCSWWRVIAVGKEPSADSLGDDYETHLVLAIRVDRLQIAPDAANFVFKYIGQLSVTNAISVDQDCIWITATVAVEGLACFDNVERKVVG